MLERQWNFGIDSSGYSGETLNQYLMNFLIIHLVGEIIMIPFFVADCPMSLNLLKFCEIDKQNSKIGLMGHANTTQNFQKLFKDFNGKNIVKMADKLVRPGEVIKEIT